MEELLAKTGHNLIASPSSGIQGLVARAYKQFGGNEFIGYYSDIDLMEKMGEKVLVEPDTKILTNGDYPLRNAVQTSAAQGIITMTGGFGTLVELLTGAQDYAVPISYYKNSSLELDSTHKGCSINFLAELNSLPFSCDSKHNKKSEVESNSFEATSIFKTTFSA